MHYGKASSHLLETLPVTHEINPDDTKTDHPPSIEYIRARLQHHVVYEGPDAANTIVRQFGPKLADVDPTDYLTLLDALLPIRSAITWEEDGETKRENADNKALANKWGFRTAKQIRQSALEDLSNGQPIHYLLENLVAQGEMLGILGDQKTCKTTLAIDLALSISSNVPAFSHFAPPAGRMYSSPAAIISTEVGPDDFGLRIEALMQSRGIPDDTPFYFQKDGKLDITDAACLSDLEDMIRDLDLRFLCLESLYLMLGSASASDTNNQFAMAKWLRPLKEMTEERDCTLCIVHHTNPKKYPSVVPKLSDSTGRGVQEMIRQWIMVARRKPYKEGSGQHHLRFSAGGSLGFSGLYDLDLSEGTPEAPEWVTCVVDKHKADLQAREDKVAEISSRRDSVIQALKDASSPLSYRQLADVVRVPRDACREIAQDLIKQGLVKDEAKGRASQLEWVQE